MELLREEGSVPSFILPDVQTGRQIEYSAYLRQRRIVLLVLGKDENSAGHVWWENAIKKHARDFAERDLTVLAIQSDKSQAERLPEGFHLLRDTQGEVEKRLGGPPAFYLVGKDTGIKWATRTFPPVADLLRRIDAMPMRRQEMRGHGR